MPSPRDPDAGSGHAKSSVQGVNDIDGLLVACTDAIYRALLAEHCAVETTRVQRQIARYHADGSFDTTGCAAVGCDVESRP